MADDGEHRSRRRGRRDDPYTNFYAMYYGPEGDLDGDEDAPPPTRHRAATGRTGAALLAGWQALAGLVRGRAMLVLSVGLVGVGILIVGVMVSATRLGGDPAYRPSLVDTSGSPSESETSLSTAASAPESTSSAAATTPGDSSSADQPIAGGDDIPPVYYPPTSEVGGTTPAASSTPDGPTSSSHPPTTSHSTPPRTTSHSTPPPTTTHSTPTPTPPETTSESPTPTPTPSPTPTRKCLIPDPTRPGHCILWEP
jgi:hypothetical protein